MLHHMMGSRLTPVCCFVAKTQTQMQDKEHLYFLLDLLPGELFCMWSGVVTKVFVLAHDVS